MLPKGLPKHTLGWQVLNWGSTYLGQPDGKYKGELWKYSKEQAQFILWFYALDDNGAFAYRRAVLERPKGWGKSPLLAAICCTELLGPVRFDGWDAEGKPVGAPAYSPHVQIAAISDSQADNTMVLVGEMLVEGRAIDEYPIEVMLSKVTAPGRKLEKVTASPRGREGNRATFVVMDETHLWVPAERGPELADALRRNLGKMNARSIETTNAPVPGEQSVAEGSHDAYEMMLEGRAFDNAILFDTREVFIDDIYDPEKAYPALETVYGDAAKSKGGWVDLDRIFAEINDPNTKEHVARRFYFNQRVEGHSAWLKPVEWQSCKDESIELRRGERFALGFAGTPRNGGAMLVACRLEDNALFNLRFWEKPDGANPDWELPWTQVDTVVRAWLSKEDCFKLVAYPKGYQDIVGRWYEDFEDKVEEFWLQENKAKGAKAVEQFEDMVKAKRLLWKDPALSRHIMNCHILETPQGNLIRKEREHSKRYIDGARAGVLALEAAILSLEEGALKKEEEGTLWSF